MLLVLDTATAACSAALLDDGRVVAERHELVGRGHAERLVPMLAELLAEAGARPSAVLVDCGPGSFTGLRVGLAAGRAFALGWGVPASGYSSLALIAAMTPAAVMTVAIVGGHGELFVQRFAHPLRALSELASLTPEAADRFAGADPVVGSGAAAMGRAPSDALPRAAEARLLPAAFRALPLKPLYGRAPDAKVAA